MEYWVWEVVGLFAVFLLFMRWFFQMHFSKKANKSVNPLIFWYISIFAMIIQFVYAVHLNSIAISVASIFGVFVAVFNIFIEKNSTGNRLY